MNLLILDKECESACTNSSMYLEHRDSAHVTPLIHCNPHAPNRHTCRTFFASGAACTAVSVLIFSVPLFSAAAPAAAEEEQEIGRSVEGRPILAHTLGDGPVRIAIIGGIHTGREEESVHIVRELVDHFRENPDHIPEPETQALYDYLMEIEPEYALSYHGYAALLDHNGTGGAQELSRRYADTVGFELIEGWPYYPITGEFIQAMAEQGIAAADVELREGDPDAFERHLRGVRAVLAEITSECLPLCASPPRHAVLD